MININRPVRSTWKDDMKAINLSRLLFSEGKMCYFKLKIPDKFLALCSSRKFSYQPQPRSLEIWSSRWGVGVFQNLKISTVRMEHNWHYPNCTQEVISETPGKGNQSDPIEALLNTLANMSSDTLLKCTSWWQNTDALPKRLNVSWYVGWCIGWFLPG